MKQYSILSIVFLFILSLVGLTACGQTNQPTIPSITTESTSSEPETTTVSMGTTFPESTESTEPTYYVTGEWYCPREDDSLVLILNDDMSFNVLHVDNSDASLISNSNGMYAMSGKKITLNYDSGTQWECDYDSVNLCITVDEYTFMYYSKSSTHYYSIAGTWVTLCSDCNIPFYIGNLSHSADSVTYYSDNSYAINYDGYNSYHGRYSVIHDGTAVEMDDSNDYYPGEVMSFQLLSNDILLIEADPSWDSGIYYVLVRIGN